MTIDTRPLLVLVDKSGKYPLSTYILEILDIEGFRERAVVDTASTPLNKIHLDEYAVVLAAEGTLADSDEDQLRRAVEGGVHLIAMRPPTSLAPMFGLHLGYGLNQTVEDQYSVFDTEHELGADLPASYTQFHGTSDLYRGAGCAVLARIAVDPAAPTGFVAVGTHRCGDGVASVFSYDLAGSTVVFHQGDRNDSSVGSNPDADGDGRWVPNDMFVRGLDRRLRFVPQADVQQDILVRLINQASRERTPVPRLWYFPNAAPCVAFINGDSDGMDRADYDTVIDTVERYGAVYTLYLMTRHHQLITPPEERYLRSRGHSFGQHVILDWDAGVSDASRQVAIDMRTFQDRFGYRPVTNRGHCLIWPGWTEMAEILANNGVCMDQNFIPRRFLRSGYLNGSGLPVRFMKQNGQLVELYEQNTHLTDDGEVEEEKFLVAGHDREAVVATALTMLGECHRRYHGVFQASFHPHLTVRSALWLLEAILGYCLDHGIPTVSGDAWVQFNDARRRVALQVTHHDLDAGNLAMTVTAEQQIHGATIMLPQRNRGLSAQVLTIDGQSTSTEHVIWKGQDYVICCIDLEAGNQVHVEALYGAPDLNSSGQEHQSAH